MTSTDVRPSSPTSVGGLRGFRRGAWGRRLEYFVMSAVSGAIVAVLSEYWLVFGQSSLRMGWGDHIVLAPRGIQQADPTAYVGDWFTREAPQPHWLFDYVIQFGWSTGQIVKVLFGYWVLTLFIFGMATALLARPWGRRHPWIALVGVSMLGSLMPYSVAGSTWLGYPSAVPNMMGGALLYLLTAALVTGHYRWCLVVLPILCAVHVQVGAIALVVTAIGALLCVPLIRREFAERDRAADATGLAPRRTVADGTGRRSRGGRGRLVVYGLVWLASAAIVVVAMKARQVASNRDDFVEICNTLIPYHCAADTWSTTLVLVVFGACLLTLAAVVYVVPGRRLIYLGTLGLCAVGTLVAMLLDRFHVPVLGELMQALNGYRVALAMYPYCAWAIMLPFLRPPTTRKRIAAAIAVVVGAVLFFCGQFGKIALTDFVQLVRPYAVVTVLAYVALIVLTGFIAHRALPVAGGSPALGAHPARAALRRIEPRTAHRLEQAIGVALLVGLMLASWGSGAYFVRHPQPAAWGDKYAAQWGPQAKALVPVGAQVIIPPARDEFRLPLMRGVIVDCKDIPYGGAPYAEWKKRIDALGGPEQCPSLQKTYDDLSALKIVDAAEEFHADAIIVSGKSQDQVRDLSDLGWEGHYVEAGTMNSWIFLRPGLKH